VVVAVLLDSFYQAKQRDLEQRAGEEVLAEHDIHPHVHSLDPLLDDLVDRFDTGRSLDALLDELFVCFEGGESGPLTFNKFSRGMRKLNEQVPLFHVNLFYTASCSNCPGGHIWSLPS
jgi:hypothetical protein